MQNNFNIYKKLKITSKYIKFVYKFYNEIQQNTQINNIVILNSVRLI